MKKLFVILIALSSTWSLAAEKFRISCTEEGGFATFSSPTKPFNAKINEAKLNVPESSPGLTKGEVVISNQTHLVMIERYEDRVTISLNKKKDENNSVIESFASYKLVDNNPISLIFSGGDGLTRLKMIKCKIKVVF